MYHLSNILIYYHYQIKLFKKTCELEKFLLGEMMTLLSIIFTRKYQKLLIYMQFISNHINQVRTIYNNCEFSNE